MDTSLMMATPDIASMASVMTQSKVQNDIGTAMLAKTMQTSEANGAALTKMMELSVNPSVGGNFDMSV